MDNVKDKMAAGLVFTWIAFLCGVVMIVVSGWVMNIMALAALTVSETTFGALEVLRVVGVVIIPIGAVMGWIS